MSKAVNTHITLNTVMKKTAVFHYTEWKNRKEGGDWGGGELGKYTDWSRIGFIPKQCLHFLESLLISSCKYTCWSTLSVYITNSGSQKSIFGKTNYFVFLRNRHKSPSLHLYLVNSLTHWAEGAHAVAALLPCQVLLIAYRAHTIGSWVAIETAARGTKHGHRALIRLLGHY